MQPSIKAIIFDLDGTLYNFKGMPFKLCLSLPKDCLKLKADRTAKRQMKGIDYSTAENYNAEYSKIMANLTSLKNGEVLSWYNDCYMATMQKVLAKHYRMRDGLESLFVELNRQGIKIAIFSDYPIVKERANAIGFTQKMWDCVSCVYSSADFGAQKPAVRPFLQIASKLNTECKDILVVGDRDDTDGEGARKSGMQFIQIKTHKTKIIDPNHQVLSWKEFSGLVVRG